MDREKGEWMDVGREGEMSGWMDGWMQRWVNR